MSLATASANMVPNLQTVLLKYITSEGFDFFTHYQSKKAIDINDNPNVALIFPWISLERQVIIRGKVKKIPIADSIKYSTSRPYNSQLSALVSQQSAVINSRTILEIKLDKMKKNFRKIKYHYRISEVDTVSYLCLSNFGKNAIIVHTTDFFIHFKRVIDGKLTDYPHEQEGYKINKMSALMRITLIS